MFFDKRVFLVASLLQSVATVDGRKAQQQELIRDGPKKTEGCGQNRCALWNIPTDWGVPFETASSLFESFGYRGSSGSCLNRRLQPLSGDCDCYEGDLYCPFTTPYFNELEWTTRLDKDALCQICLSPPKGNMEEVKAFFRENNILPFYLFFKVWFDQYDYAADNLDCQGLSFDIEQCEQCLQENGFDENLSFCSAICLNPQYPDELLELIGSAGGAAGGGLGGLGGLGGGAMYLYDDEGVVTYTNPPKYKKISKLFWSEDGSQPNTGDDYYCANRFQNYVDPCCLESSAPSVKPTPPTGISDISLAPTTGSDNNPCFSESATVEVQGKGKVTMALLQVGDVVLTPSGYEKVYTIDHRSEYKNTDFIKIHTDFEGALEVTGTHLMYKVGEHDPVEARFIMVGDELQGFIDGEMKSVVVEQITTISKNGFYNPITSSGKIVVNGLVTSTYTAVNLNDGMNYLTVGGFKILSMHDFLHLAMVPFKAICMPLSASICSVTDGNEHNSYNQIGLTLMAYGKSQNVYVQNAILLSLIILFLCFYLLSNPVVIISLIFIKAMKKGTKIE